MQHIKTPVDLVSLPCISPVDVQQAIDTAYPYPNQGFILWSDSAPDTVADPILVNFLWGLTIAGVRPISADQLVLYFYNGSSWEQVPFGILPGSITLDKFNLTGSSPLDILQINSGGTALTWIDLISAITNNTIPPVKLLIPNNSDTFVLTGIAGTKAFTEISAFIALIPANSIPVADLVKGAADPLKKVLTTKVDGSAIEWSALDIANIGAAGSAASQYLRRNAGNTAWEFATPPATTVTALINGGTYWPVPGSATVQAIPHGLGAIPSIARVVLRCATAVDGFSVGDELELFSVTADIDGTNQNNAFGFVTDSTNITVIATGFATGITYTPKTGGAQVTFDNTKWKLKAYVIP